MSKNNRIQRLPVEVDPFRLVEQGRIYEGRMPLGDFPRLKELLFDDSTCKQSNANENIEENLINVELEFTRTETNLPVVNGKISTILEMPCQRCLKAESIPFETTFNIVLVASDAQAERLQEGYDTWLVEEQRLFLQDFIEDEILLAMPLVVRHEACESIKELIEELPEDTIDSAGDNEENEEIQKEDNPFSVLKDLKLK